MTRWRSILIWTLLGVPWLLILVLGSYALWEIGWSQWVWVPIAFCWGLALILMRVWRTRWQFLSSPKVEAVPHWTPRDNDAWQLVEAKASTIETLDQERLLTPQFYFDTAMELATQIARVYHPKSDDPVADVTVPEILAALELAFEDLSAMVDQYVPASHMLTVKHWRNLARLPKLYQNLSKFYWPVSAVLAPATLIARYATSKMIVSPITQNIQENLLSWFYVSYVHRIGYYIVELNSGRLAVGKKRFREMTERLHERFDATGTPQPVDDSLRESESSAGEASSPQEDSSQQGDSPQQGSPQPSRPPRSEITICLVGQSKAGKSSLVNALLGERRAEVDVVPKTDAVTRYQLDRQETNDHLVVLDTVGYATEGFTAAQQKSTEAALRESDLVLLVMNAANPARQPDADTLAQLREWFQSRRDLRPIPILGVLTHIDLLRPVREWEPPYDWQTGLKPKEESIRQAVDYHRELLGNGVAGIVPVCTDVERERVFGVEEFLVPAMTSLLGDARASALLRSLHKEISRNKAGRVVQQLWEIGKLLVKAGTTGSQNRRE